MPSNDDYQGLFCVTTTELVPPKITMDKLQLEQSADNLAHHDGQDDVKDNEQPHTQMKDNTELLMREKLAKDFLGAIIRQKEDAHQNYNVAGYVRTAFKYADEFLNEANRYREEAELEVLL